MAFGLLYAEIRAIRVDRIEQTKHALEERAAQDEHFKAIREVQDQDFKSTAGRLTVAIAGINSTIQTATKTLEQTTPHAFLHYVSYRLDSPDSTNKKFVPGLEYKVQQQFHNDGSENALLIKEFAQVYVGKPDDKDTQIKLGKQFENDWNNAPKYRTATVDPFTGGFFTTFRKIAVDEAIDLNVGKSTIYVLRRLEYSDSMGRWFSDDCFDLQVLPNGIYINVTHPCVVFSNVRYPAMQHLQ